MNDPATITDVDTFSAPILVPSGATVRNAASVAEVFQQLANRTRHNKNRLEALNPTTGGDAGEYLYPTPLQRTITIDLMEARAIGSWAFPSDAVVGAATRTLVGTGGREQLYVPLNKYLRHGQYLIDIRMMAKPGSDPGPGDRMQFNLYRTPNLDYTAPAAPGAAVAITGAELAGTVAAAVTVAVPGIVVVLRRGTTARDYFIVVETTDDVTTDDLYSVAVTVEDRRVGNS